jgi:hypothetical protein
VLTSRVGAFVFALSSSLVAAASLAACGGGDDPVVDDARPPDGSPGTPDASPNPVGPVELVDLPARLQDAVCAFEARCGLMPDVTTCRAVFDPATTDVAQLAAYATSGRLTYDATKAGECLTAYRDAACEWNADGGLGPSAVCDEVFRGDKVEGVACFADEECLGALVCETIECVGGCCAGTCKAKAAEAPVGGDCRAAPCGANAYCRLDGAGAAACATRAAVGAACDAVDACAAGSVCSAGTCVAIGGDGAACDPAAFAGCAGIDRWCDPASATCVARKAIGAVCGGEGECIEAAACVGGSCVMRPRPGDACGAGATGGGCLGELPCVGGVCQAQAVEEVCP